MSEPTARAVLDRHVSEKQFMQAVIDLAQRCHFWAYHTRDSRRSERGFPDLVLVKPGRDGQPGRLILAELKSQSGRLVLEQRVWLHGLRTVPGIEVYEWKPSQWDAIVAVLTGEW